MNEVRAKSVAPRMPRGMLEPKPRASTFPTTFHMAALRLAMPPDRDYDAGRMPAIHGHEDFALHC